LRTLAKEMTEAMYAAPGVGLAANQVGLALRLFVYDAGDGSGPGAVANPEILEADGEQNEDEGCLSIPGVYRPTRRALRVRLRGVDLDGAPVSIEAEGLGLPNETDHLNGSCTSTAFRARRRSAWPSPRHRAGVNSLPASTSE
jgi:peptide deformylase